MLAGPFLALLTTGLCGDSLAVQKTGERSWMAVKSCSYTAIQCTESILPPFTRSRGRHYPPLVQKRLNRALASVRIAVENAFGQTKQLWTYMAFEKGLKSGLQAIDAHFAAAILLTNCYACIRGNAIGTQFLVLLATVKAYFDYDNYN